eukprot:14093586-Ditylum_brightwellii.AAC.1
MWQGCSHALVLLKLLRSKKTPWKWTSTEQEAFDQAKKMVSQETWLVYPYFNILFNIHMDTSNT